MVREPPKVALRVRAAELRDGMVLARDLRSSGGMLLLARGQPLSRAARRHLWNLCENGAIPEVLDVLAEPADEAATAYSGSTTWDPLGA
jgi:hypothetical protein